MAASATATASGAGSAPAAGSAGTSGSAEGAAVHEGAEAASPALSSTCVCEPPAGCATGSFASNPVGRLAALLSERDAPARADRVREALAASGLTNCSDGSRVEEFIAALERSSTACRRAALLFSRNGEVAVSFNGGKDACVVLFLWLASLAAVAANSATAGEAVFTTGQTVIFFDSPDEFPRVKQFVDWVVRSLGLRKTLVECRDFKKGMEGLVSSGLRAVVMGQRRGDPWMDKVDVFTPSTDGWAPFMRVNPIMDWTYGDVWLFLRAFGLPYCKMYDEGYTSIGNTHNTEKNAALRRADGSYAPAYELRDGSLERAARAQKNGEAATNGYSKNGVKVSCQDIRPCANSGEVEERRRLRVTFEGQDAEAIAALKELLGRGLPPGVTVVAMDPAEDTSPSPPAS